MPQVKSAAFFIEMVLMNPICFIYPKRAINNIGYLPAE